MKSNKIICDICKKKISNKTKKPIEIKKEEVKDKGHSLIIISYKPEDLIVFI